MSDREFLRAFARHPSAENFRPFLELYLAFVYSAAHSLQHDDARAADVTRAVFFAFAYKARKLPKKTVVAGWLFRMTRLASEKLIQNPRLCATAGQPPLSAPRGGEEGKGAFRGDPETRALWTTLAPNIDEAVDRLPVKVRDAVLLHLLLGWACAETARALHTSEKRAKKRLDHGLKTLNHVFRKRGWSLRAEDLALCRAGEGWGAEPPASLHSEILRLVEEGVGKKPSLSLARHTLRALSWLRWRRRFKVATVAALVFFVLMAGAGLYIASLWRSGHLMAWFITSSAQWQAKSVRGLSQAARPWPADSRPLLKPGDIRTAGDVYQMTNVWLAHLNFSPAQWKSLEPTRIDPVPKLIQPDGVVILRNPKAQRSGLAGALGFDFNWSRGDLEFSDISFPNVRARFKGNGTYLLSLYGLKRSFKVDVGKSTSGEQLGGVEELNFTNLIDDRSYMSDALAYEFFREAGVPAPRTAYAWLTLSVPGTWKRKPLGLYLLVESLDRIFAAERFGSKRTPIFKPVTYQLFEDLGAEWSSYADIYDLKTKATEEQRRRVIDFSRLISHASDRDLEQRLGEFLDLEEFARFLASLVLLSSYDGFLSDGQNLYVYLDPKSNKFGFIPWDLDHAWGAFYLVGRPEERERASIWHPWVGRNRFLERVIAVEPFRRIYRARLEELLSTLFVPSRLSRRIDEIASLIRSPIAAESTRRLDWFDLAVSDKWVKSPRDADRTGPNRPVHQLKHFLEARAKSVRQQLDGKSKGVMPGWGK